MVRRVDHHSEELAANPVENDVVDASAAIVGQERVLPCPVPQFRDVVGGDPLDELECALPSQFEAGHVAHVEHPRAVSNRQSLGDDALILDGHVEPGEGNHLPAEGDVRTVEGRAEDRFTHTREYTGSREMLANLVDVNFCLLYSRHIVTI
ncbi:MAG: hypothetical protein UZ18_ATM001001758 [Armatimonadetes bacterium OLB18]|nr:MAG: hypothetical protein UZ18_ATM001001758 [Armatimonadetes bacterium OLB18]